MCPSVIVGAKDQALTALRSEKTVGRVAEFYDPETNFAGATFAHLMPNCASAISATDLIAVTTLGVRIGNRAVRHFIAYPERRSHLGELLSALPPQLRLEDATADDFANMERFYDAVKSTLATPGAKKSNRWVTASKITARKRPGLFPVRDSVVCTYLGISELNDRARDWFVFRELMRDSDVLGELGAFREKLEAKTDEKGHAIDSEPLRLLDAALWRHAGGREERK